MPCPPWSLTLADLSLCLLTDRGLLFETWLLSPFHIKNLQVYKIIVTTGLKFAGHWVPFFLDIKWSPYTITQRAIFKSNRFVNYWLKFQIIHNFFKRLPQDLACSDAQLCFTLCDPVDCRLPGSFVCGILQARILEWVAISYSKESSPSWDRTCVSCIGRWIIDH